MRRFWKRLLLAAGVLVPLVGAAPFLLFGAVMLELHLFPLDGTPMRTAMDRDAAGRAISLERVATHPFLAEYDRWLVVSERGRDLARFELFPDTGGAGHVKVYRSGEEDMQFADRFDRCTVRLASDPVTLSCGTDHPMAGPYLGAFDDAEEPDGRRYRFVPVVERPERASRAIGRG